jgi:hypothetical protein
MQTGFYPAIALLLMNAFSMNAQEAKHQIPKVQEKQSFENYIRGCTVSPEVIARFLKGPSLATYDPEFGYVRRDYVRHDALDNSSAIYTFRPDGSRTRFLYANRKPRINVYGDSFTEGTQVNDGETWEEYLAGHLGEPIGNFGIGGYGVYQAYRRMIREERTDHGAEYVILYIWGDDPVRSLFRSHYCALYQGFNQGHPNDDGRARNFHGNFWPHLELDTNTGQFVERQNPLSTRESLYRMTDPQWMVDHLKDDLALQLSAYSDGATQELDRKQITKLSASLGFPFDWGADAKTANVPRPDPAGPAGTRMQVQAAALLNRYSQRANIYILEKARAFTKQNGKKLLVLIFDPENTMQQVHNGNPRDDQETLDYLVKEKFDYFDMNVVHVQDFKKYNVSWDEYLNQYFIGHYNPRGNNFFAYSIKDKVIDWLNPKPITYRNPDAASFDFKDYLGEYH